MMTEGRPLPAAAEIKGVGAETAKDLDHLGIATVGDLFLYFPYRYDNYEIRDLADARHEESVTVVGKVHSEPSLTFYARKKSRLSVRMLTGRYLVTVIAFNRPYLKKKLQIGATITVTGKWDMHRAQVAAGEIHIGEPGHDRMIEPVYPVGGSLSVKRLRKIMKQAFVQFPAVLDENLPADVLTRYKLMGRREAIREIHFPTERLRLKQARRRLVYEEFLLFQLKLQVHKKIERKAKHGRAVPIDRKRTDVFVKQLPFSLTAAQRRAAAEILDDLAADFSMNRLLQGDVGSGKTIVAAIALFSVVTAGYQGALMVPTEILAGQHAESLQKLFAPYGLNVALLTSSVKGKRRKLLLENLLAGNIDILVGTHALIQEDVNFHKLALVVTDEQHRFGVVQRRTLRTKGTDPDVLYMTATPIPRTLAISVFGDMDVSTIDEMPNGRKGIKTYWVRRQMMARVIQFIKTEIGKGRQAYVVCPLIEESEQLDVQNALDVHAEMVQALPGYAVGLMHGRLSPQEKDEVMSGFKTNHIQVLVSTTVVEVGVNVPNATIMVIYDAGRFGLSQLHQLRGRVGRGRDQSYCILVADARSAVSQEKMRIMTETTDGFKLSEYDLKLRGPGDFFGKKQSGLPEFKVADMIHDYRTLAVAKADAARLVSSSQFWQDPDWALVRSDLEAAGVFDSGRLD